VSRQQRRFTKEFEVLAEILKFRRKAKLKLERAELIEAQMQGMVESMNSPMATPGDVAHLKEQHGYERRKAVKLRRSIEIINDDTIPRLTRTLSALQTLTLPGMKDEGVVLQK